MHLFRRGASTAPIFLLLFGLGGVGACSSEAPMDTVGSPEGTRSETGNQVLGRFLVQVDPGAAEPVSIEPLARGAGPSLKPQAVESVLLGNQVVTVTGGGTWHAGTERLTANVVITSNSASVLDEPRMEIISVTGPGAANVVFETAHHGGTGQGAVMEFADIQGTASSNVCPAAFAGVKTSARHRLSIHAPGAQSFNFAVDVVADVGATEPGSIIRPDCDGDGFNIEVGELAGNDCNDAIPALNPYVPPVLGNPNLLPAGNTCGCSPTSCTTPGATCNSTLFGGAETCAAANVCACDINASNGQDIHVTCEQDCGVDCSGANDSGDSGDLACQVDCRRGSDCRQECTNMTAGSCLQNCPAGPNVNNAQHEGSACELDCANNPGGCTQDCRNNATCDFDCSNNAEACAVSCLGASTCDMDCASNPGGCTADCRQPGTACNVDCSNGTDDCSLNCQNQATCDLNCADSPGGCAAVCNNSTCDLDCTDNPGGCSVQCQNGADCSLECDGSSPDCWYTACAGQASECDANCVGSGDRCGMADCQQAECEVTCGAAGEPADYGTICGIQDCRGAQANCHVACVDSPDCFLSCRNNVPSGNCTMDCSTIPVAERFGPNGRCDIVCVGPRTVQETGVGTGIYGCF